MGRIAAAPFEVEKWFERLKLAPKTKGHIKAVMHRLFECAMKWALFPLGRNPMELVEIKDVTKRQKPPRVLTHDEFWKLLKFLGEPYRTMVMVAQCLGLRISEVMALQWGDFDFANLIVRVQRGIVHGRVDVVKTEYSNDDLPLDPEFAAILLDWKRQCPTTPETVKAHLTGRCFSGSKPNEVSNWELAQLQNLGYFDAKVSDPTVTVLDASRHPQPVSLNLRFTKGARYRVRGITWSGIQAISMERIASISELRPQDILGVSKVEDTLDTVRLLYHAIGYADVVITPQIQRDKTGHWAIVNYKASEGVQYPLSRFHRI